MGGALYQPSGKQVLQECWGWSCFILVLLCCGLECTAKTLRSSTAFVAVF